MCQLQRVRDGLVLRSKLRSEEDDGGNDDHGDQRENQRVFHEALPSRTSEYQPDHGCTPLLCRSVDLIRTYTLRPGKHNAVPHSSEAIDVPAWQAQFTSITRDNRDALLE